MKLRFSNGHDFAMSFEASDIAAFHEQGLLAIRSFRIATERRVHRGEIHKTVSWCESAELAMSEDGKQWWTLGNKKSLRSDGPLDGAVFFDPRPVTIPWREGDTLDDIHHEDKKIFLASIDKIWRRCVDTWEWMGDINLIIMKLGDDLDKLTQ